MAADRYDRYRLNKSVVARAEWAFNEHLWKRGVSIPEGQSGDVNDALAFALREAVKAGRTNGWFERKDMPDDERQSYKVHLFCGEGMDAAARSSRYGFHKMEVGKTYFIEFDDIPKLRAAATSYAKDRGWSFTVNKRDGGALVTRTA